MPASANPVPKTRREEYADSTRGALVAAAQEIFVAHGYQETGVEAIARAARVTRGAFYHHFEDKKALFEALVLTLQQQAVARISARARAEPDAGRRLSAGALAFLEVSAEPAYRRLVIQEAPAVLGAARCREIGEGTAFGLLIGALRDLDKAGTYKLDNPHLAGRMIGTMICEAALLLGDAKRPVELKRQAVAIVERVLDAFRVK